MKKRIVTLLFGIIFTCSLFTGCQENTQTENYSAEEKTSEDNTIYGQIKSINNSTITLNLRNADAPHGNGMDGPHPASDNRMDEPPAMSRNDMDESRSMSKNGMDESSSMSKNGMDEPPSMSNNNMDKPPSASENDMGESPSSQGNPPDNNGDGPESSKEVREITITDDTVYTVEEGQDSREGSLEDLTEMSMVRVTLEEDGITAISITIQNDRPQDTDTSDSPELSGAKTIDGKKASSSDETFSSSSKDENVVLVTNHGNLSMAGAALSKSGDTSNTDDSNFYGLNAALAVTQSSTAKLINVEITSSGEGSNAIFVTGEGSSAIVDTATIHTKGNSARGLDATYGGTINASNVEILTEGEHCAALATDRGEGTVTVNGATLSTAGEGSPCIYSTGEITVRNATGTASQSQTLVVEGKNSVELTKCDLTGAGPNGLMLYQSTSGDAQEGTAIFRADDSRLTTTSEGPMIYVTNTDAEVSLTATDLSFPGEILISAAGNATNNWGNPGQNGGTLTLTGTRQELKGDVSCDEISTVCIILTENSTFTGAVDKEHTGKETALQLDDSSTWNVTADSYLTSLSNSQKDCSNILSNGHNVYYDASHEDNKWLNGQQLTLPGGGTLSPV